MAKLTCLNCYFHKSCPIIRLRAPLPIPPLDPDIGNCSQHSEILIGKVKNEISA